MNQTMNELVKRLWYVVVYAIFNIGFLISLNKLNAVLLSEGLDENPWELLAYNDHIALKYFGFAVVIFLVGILLFVILMKRILGGECDVAELIATLFSAFAVLMLLVILIILIDNPILRAVMGIGIIGAFFLSAQSN
ncbi:putative membrane protein [Aequitasia blattaphilus]|uniref:Uncharacterized protein n=1 Tax=Aequitasia blattaphilus TaxID=2949332 RepID=A0ABT1E831_9FIRM|nr:hypothetical protein [Aequitasia blattaphilus]MCP1101989.1 hypothetical protein [Aequitasia blattaphilus]MCR8614629.1 hypothetical protein [Aequitasia blattaphilus]